MPRKRGHSLRFRSEVRGQVSAETGPDARASGRGVRGSWKVGSSVPVSVRGQGDVLLVERGKQPLWYQTGF